MTTEEMREVWRQRQAGWAELHRREVEMERERTVEDRMRDLDRIVQFARVTGMKPRIESDSEVTETWQRLRKHYGRDPRHPV